MSPLYAVLLAVAGLAQEIAPPPTDDALVRYGIQASLVEGSVHASGTVDVPSHLTSGSRVRLLPRAAKGPGSPVVTLGAVRDAAGRTLEPVPGEDGSVWYRIEPGPDGTATLSLEWTADFYPGNLNTYGFLFFSAERPGTRWYPEIVAPDGEALPFAAYDVDLEWTGDRTVVTTGTPVEEHVDGAARRARFVAERAEGFTLVVAGEGFERRTFTRDGMSVDVLLPADQRDAYERIGEHTLDAALFYRDLYGFFPVDRISVVPGFPRAIGGWPMPNVFMVHRAGGLGETFTRFITAHELGHYYWGLHVLDDGERLDWLMLANGILADQIYLASLEGRSLEEQWRRTGEGNWLRDYLTAAAAGREQRLGLGRAFDATAGFDYNTLVRHGKGATGLYLQARRLGVDRFVEFQRGLLDEFRHRPLDLDTFVERLEAAGADGAGEFFDAWTRGDAVIGYDVVRVDAADEAGAPSRVIVRRTGTVAYPVEVEMRGADGAVERARVGLSSARVDTVVTRVRAPVSVRFDPDGAVPMANSSHPGMRSLYLRALVRAGRTGEFLLESGPFLDEHWDASVARDRIERLVAMGHADELAREAERSAVRDCRTRLDCLAAVELTEGLVALDRPTEAAALTERIATAARAVGLGERIDRVRGRAGGGDG